MDILFILTHSFSGNNCEYIKVPGGHPTIKGLYVETDKTVPAAPNNSVWKRRDHKMIDAPDRYIFNTGSAEGWRIGNESHLSTTQDFYYKGEN